MFITTIINCETLPKNQMLGNAFKKSGAKGYWGKMLEISLESKNFETVQKAVIYAKLDERDKAFEFLEKAFNERTTTLLWLKVSPELDSLRADPRFPDLVRRVGLIQ